MVAGQEDGGGCEGMAQTKQVRFQIFLSKLAAPTPGKEGPITGVNSYALFQFDGVGGINNLGGAGTYVCMPLA